MCVVCGDPTAQAAVVERRILIATTTEVVDCYCPNRCEYSPQQLRAMSRDLRVGPAAAGR